MSSKKKRLMQRSRYVEHEGGVVYDRRVQAKACATMTSVQCKKWADDGKSDLA